MEKRQAANPLTAAEKVKIIAMWESGKMYSEIAKEIGRSAKGVSNAIYRIRQESASRGIILERKPIKKKCPICGTGFEVQHDVGRTNKIYCSPECKYIAKKGRPPKKREPELLGEAMKYKEPPFFDGVAPTMAEIAVKTDRHRTKWGAIAAKCEALGLSYGDAVSRGLL